MNRFIGKINNGKVEIVTLTSGDPKKALTNYIFKFQNKDSLTKSQINKKIKHNNKKYYYNEYFI